MFSLVRIAGVVLALASAAIAARAEETPAPLPSAPVAAAPAAPAGPTVTVPDPSAPAETADAEPPVDLAELAIAGPLGDMALGDPKAPVTVIEYASMTCPHCQRFHTQTFPHLKSEYIDKGKVYYVLREFPLDELALAAVMLARCAPPEKFFSVINVLFEMQENWAASDNPGPALFNYLQPMGFTADTFNACLENQTVLEGVNAVRQRAADKLGVQATPTFFFNGKMERGELSVEQVDAILKPML